MEKEFRNLLEKSNIDLNDESIKELLIYLELLVEKNKHINLTAIRDEKDILEKHFIDSLLLNKLICENDKNIIDIGTGAGFPGLVLAIVNKDKNFLLVDSVNKKINFLNEVIENLKLKNVKTSSERAEELIKKHREKFDVALCRGVANMRIILEYLIPFLKVNGRFLPQKLNDNEIKESSNAMKLLNSSLNKTYTFNLPICLHKRYIFEIVKNKKTDKKYPRSIGIPSKKPL